MSALYLGPSPTSVVLRRKLLRADTGQGLTGLTTGSSGLVISTIKIGETSATAYSGANLETIATLGTYAAPTAGKVRFKEVDATNHPGVYEVQIADARFASTDRLVVSINGVTNLLEHDVEIELSTAYADALLKRDMSAVTGEAARSLLNALRFLRNKWAIASGTLTVYKEDDSTSAWTKTTSTDATAAPIVGLN